MGMGFNGIPGAEVEITGGLEGKEVQKLSMVRTTSGTTTESVPVGKVWKVFGGTIGLYGYDTSTGGLFGKLNLNGDLYLCIWTYGGSVSPGDPPVSPSASHSLGSNYVKLSAGETITLETNDSQDIGAMVFYIEEDA